MKTPRFSIRFLLLGVLCTALGLLGVQWYLKYQSAGSRYQRTGSQADLREAFATDIRPGDTYAQVAERIGPGEVLPAGSVEKLLRWQEEGRIPAGYHQKGDQFVQYASDGPIVYGLEFRDGKLIHFDPERFSKPGNNIPSLSER